jgi:hypothetical protein
MVMHWLKYVIGIVGKGKWNTFLFVCKDKSLDTIWNSSSSKVWSFCVFKQIFSLKALTTDVVTAQSFYNA